MSQTERNIGILIDREVGLRLWELGNKSKSLNDVLRSELGLKPTNGKFRKFRSKSDYKNIQVDQEVDKALRKKALPFESRNTLIRRLLGMPEKQETRGRKKKKD